MKKILSVLLVLGLSACDKVEDPILQQVFNPEETPLPSPAGVNIAPNPERNVYFGDLHIHSSYSFDAYTMGVRALPEDAYRFARGATIQHGVGYPIRIDRPLDFAAVTDHSEYLGVARHLGNLEPGRHGEKYDRELRDVLGGYSYRYLWYFIKSALLKTSTSERREEAFGGKALAVHTRSAWLDIVQTAQRYYAPGVFTTFIAYEWSSMPAEQHLHRNVIYRGSRVPKLPWSSLESENPEDLWRELSRQRANGMQVLAIPHNANISNGLMYPQGNFDGSPMDPALAKLRREIEPLSEIFQIKGQSETHPLLSAEDEFANFEVLDRAVASSSPLSQPAGSYARDALRTGLEMAHARGFNPYQFGVIGSTDSHNASSPAEESNYHGKLPVLDGTPGIRLGAYSQGMHEQTMMHKWSAMGLAAVWAQENTRESLFAALQRKETYATSGPRMRLRFFAGWDYPVDLHQRVDALARAYADGVPMGGVLSGASKGAPHFVLWASKDPQGANLDRLQIIKGWVDGSGQSHEKIVTVAASDERMDTAARGKVAAVGNTVDIATATYSNTIGSEQLS
ncbi:MAG: hypothetical protein DRP64_19720, partial [Verrucomicrobia bacterium]